MPQCTYNSNYDVTLVKGTFTISARPVKIVAGNASKMFGADDPAFTYSIPEVPDQYYGLVDANDLGTISVTKTGVTVNPGTYTGVLVPQYTDNANYAVTPVNGDFTITKSTALSATASDVTKIYDGSAYGIEAVPNVEGATVMYGTAEGTYGLSASPMVTDVKDSPLTVYYEVTKNGYETVYGSAKVTINPRPVKIVAEDGDKMFGDSDPWFTYNIPKVPGQYYGLVKNDDLGEIGVNNTDTSGDPGTHTGVLVPQYEDNANYVVTTENGTLTITDSTWLSATASNVEKTYDGSAYGIEVTPSIKGATVEATIKYSKTGAEGTYNLPASPTATDVKDSMTVYYEVTKDRYKTVYGSATVKINPRPVEITAQPASKTYGEADPAFGVQMTGTLVADGDLGTIGVERNAAVNDAGTHEDALEVRYTPNANYDVTTVKGDLTITPRPVTLAANSTNKTYGAPDPAFTYSVQEVPGQSYSVIGNDLGDITVARTNAAVNDAGVYPGVLAVQYADNKNYHVRTVDGNFQIIPANGMAVDAPNVSVTYDGTAHGTVVTPAVTAGTTITYRNAAGQYTDVNPTATNVNAGSPLVVYYRVVNPNYVTVEGSATVTVNPKAVTVTANSLTKTAGTADPAFTATVDGLVGTETLDYTLGRDAGEAVGSYAINVTLGSNPNYAVNTVAGTLTITAAAPPATPAAVPPTTPAAPAAPAAPGTTTVPDNQTPLGGGNAGQDENVTVDDNQTPLAGVQPTWALLNLLLAIATGIIMIVLLVGYFIGKKNKEDKQTGRNRELKRKGVARVLSIIPAVCAVVAFILTENMRNQMVFTDQWTILMIVVAAIQVVVAVFSTKGRKEDDEPTRGIKPQRA